MGMGVRMSSDGNGNEVCYTGISKGDVFVQVTQRTCTAGGVTDCGQDVFRGTGPDEGRLLGPEAHQSPGDRSDASFQESPLSGIGCTSAVSRHGHLIMLCL